MMFALATHPPAEGQWASYPFQDQNSSLALTAEPTCLAMPWRWLWRWLQAWTTDYEVLTVHAPVQYELVVLTSKASRMCMFPLPGDLLVAISVMLLYQMIGCVALGGRGMLMCPQEHFLPLMHCATRLLDPGSPARMLALSYLTGLPASPMPAGYSRRLLYALLR